MLALDYGYWVSIDAALAADRTQAAFEATEEQANAGTRKMIWSNVAAFAFLVLSLLLGYFVSPQFLVLAVLAVLIWCAVFIVDALRSRREPPIRKLTVFPLGVAPWQAWPCRVTGVREDPDSRMKLVYLMSPDQQVVRAFKTPMPEQVWKRMIHGMGVLWICGDLESTPVSGAGGVAMGTVKGEIVWEARHASKRDTMNGPQPTPAFARVIEDASSAEMDGLLNPYEPQ